MGKCVGRIFKNLLSVLKKTNEAYLGNESVSVTSSWKTKTSCSESLCVFKCIQTAAKPQMLIKTFNYVNYG